MQANVQASRIGSVLTLALLAASVLAGLAACQALVPAAAAGAADPVEAEFAAPGPFSTTTGTVTSAEGKVAYDLFYPSDYSALGFESPVVTWGNGTDATPDMYSTFLSHLASYGFTVVASTRENTGSGREIEAGALYMVEQNAAPGSVFNHVLNTSEVAAVGHSQGAGGAVNAATRDPSLIKTLMTFSLPSKAFASVNEDCLFEEECEFYPEEVTQPTFLISTHGPLDSFIASPHTEKRFFSSLRGAAALGIIEESEGEPADHSSIQDTVDGGNPGGELGYATAWLEYQLLGNRTAAAAFDGRHPELRENSNWPQSKVRRRPKRGSA